MDKNYLGVDDQYADIHWVTDNLGNVYSINVEKKDNHIIVIKTYKLQEGKTTLKTEHPKLLTETKCRHPERLSCNNGYAFDRCEFMKCIRVGVWKCSQE